MSVPLRLLIIEDSQDDAELLLRELTRGGYSVTSHRVDSSDNMHSALDRQIWDLIICDYSMPHFSGMDALRILRTRGFDTPFIFLSGTIGEDTAVAALKEGAQDYLMKGNTKRLLPAVKRELEEAERKKQRAYMEQRIRHLERFEAIGKLAGGIAHDFNNIIGVILGSAQMGEEQSLHNPLLGERFRTIRKQAEVAADLTRQLLAFARRQVMQPHKIDLNATIERINAVLMPALGPRIQFRNILDPKIHPIEADPSHLEQVILNLCLNARDAMPNGGTLVVKTENVELDARFCEMHSYGKPGTYVMLTVSDTGIGMDLATQEHIFEPFFTTKAFGKGSGLGLATVYGIVKQHGGFINVYSELAKGTTFRVYMPAAASIGEYKPPVSTQIPAPARGTILLAEDNASLKALAEEVLTSRGYRVISASDGNEALELFRQNRDKISLALLDVVMPKLNGPEAFLQMTAMKPDLPVIFTTGHAPEAISCSLDLHSGSFLQKPYTPQALADFVSAALARSAKDID